MLIRKKERAQGIVEYAFLIVLIAFVVIAAIAFMGISLSGLYTRIVASWPGA
jgi:Flp pilus assembly pilin Flp